MYSDIALGDRKESSGFSNNREEYINLLNQALFIGSCGDRGLN